MEVLILMFLGIVNPLSVAGATSIFFGVESLRDAENFNDKYNSMFFILTGIVVLTVYVAAITAYLF